MDLTEVLNTNDEDQIKKYLIQYGKSPKPRAPFYFMDKEESDNVRISIKHE